VAQNIGLGAHPRRGGVVDYGCLAAAVAEIGKELDLIESQDTPVERLPLEPRSLADKVLILARSPERCCW
jgi:ribose transport system ATP-binding protein